MSIKTKGTGMSSCRPYLVRAIYDWIIANNMTPFIVVDMSVEGVVAPLRYAQDNKIVLNISLIATQNLTIASDHLQFSARFSGIAEDIYVPIKAIMAIYTKENGRGMAFEPEDDDEPPKPTTGSNNKGSGPTSSPSGFKPQLTVVK